MRRVNLLLLSTLVVVATGCVSKSHYQRDVDTLQGQVTQLDTSLKAQGERNRALETELQGVRGGKTTGSAAFAGANYRTPSGFELPAVNIQKALKGAGYYSGSVNGKIGPDSREAIRNFQRDNGLTADGVCGRQTWLKLKTYL